MGELQAIGYNGQPLQQTFRPVDPPVTVLVDLAGLFPREPHRAGGYNPAGLQMHSVVEGRLMNVNPYGHPSVEAYTQNMMKILKATPNLPRGEVRDAAKGV